MRTEKQIKAAAEVLLNGGSKKDAMIAANYKEGSAASNTNKVFPTGTYRHILFAQGLFLFKWNKTEAAKYAGYNPKWAGTNTARLMSHPRVKAEILRFRQELFPGDFPKS